MLCDICLGLREKQTTTEWPSARLESCQWSPSSVVAIDLKPVESNKLERPAELCALKYVSFSGERDDCGLEQINAKQTNSLGRASFDSNAAELRHLDDSRLKASDGDGDLQLEQANYPANSEGKRTTTTITCHARYSLVASNHFRPNRGARLVCLSDCLSVCLCGPAFRSLWLRLNQVVY